MTSRPITLALGGGGARGVAHLGVIEILTDAGFTIERIVGVSSGSLAGAIYAFEPDIQQAKATTLKYLLSESFQRHQTTLFGTSPAAGDETTGGVFTWYDRVKGYLRTQKLFKRVIQTPSLLPGLVLQDAVNHLLPEADIADAVVPLSIVTVDLLSGNKIILERGSVRDAVRASSSLPGIFPPVEFDGMLLCDVGVFYSLPTTVAKSYASECTVAVDVSTGLKPLTQCETALDVLMRMDEIGESMFRKHVRDAADLVIRPKTSGVEWFDFSKPKQMIEAGRQAAIGAVPKLKAMFEGSAGNVQG